MVFTGAMFDQAFALKQEGLRGKKLAKAMVAKFPSYSAEELVLLAAHVPSPELRRRTATLHRVFLALLGIGSVSAALSVWSLLSDRDHGAGGLVLVGLLLLFRAVPIYMAARYRRDAALFVFLGAAATVGRLGSLHVLDVAFTATLVVVAWLWAAKLFPDLTWRGQPRSVAARSA